MAINTVKVQLDGTLHTLTLNASTGKYEATIVAPETSSYPLAGHYFPVKLTATDNAGNELVVDDKHTSFGSSLQLRVKEKIAPIIKILQPTSGQSTSDATPLIQFTVTDNNSGVDENTVVLKLDNVAIAKGDLIFDAITGGINVRHTPKKDLTDGKHMITIAATDYDGNAATPVSREFEVLAVAPDLSVDSPANRLETNKASVTLSGSSTGVSAKYTINGSAEITLTLTDGKFSKMITLTEGKNTLIVSATSRTGVITKVTREVWLDTAQPVIGNITIAPNPVDAGATFVITVKVTDIGGQQLNMGAQGLNLW
jgi:hypothetical protein